MFCLLLFPPGPQNPRLTTVYFLKCITWVINAPTLFYNVSCLQIQMRCKIRAGGSGVIINEAEKPHRLTRDHEMMHHLLQICNASLQKQHNPEGRARGPRSQYQHCKDTLIHFTVMRANMWSQDVSADDVTHHVWTEVSPLEDFCHISLHDLRAEATLATLWLWHQAVLCRRYQETKWMDEQCG